MNDKGQKLKKNFVHAYHGLKETIRTERNFRIHIITSFIVIAAGLIFRLPPLKWAIISLLIGLVLVTELLNTAIEKLLDYLKPDIHQDAKVIKDTAAGAVLCSAIIAVAAGLIIFVSEIF